MKRFKYSPFLDSNFVLFKLTRIVTITYNKVLCLAMQKEGKENGNSTMMKTYICLIGSFESYYLSLWK